MDNTEQGIYEEMAEMDLHDALFEYYEQNKVNNKYDTGDDE